MKNALLAILLCGAAVAACNANRKDEVEDKRVQGVTVDAEWEGDKGAAGFPESGVNIQADMEKGRVELKLPGGIGGTVNLPEGLDSNAKFELDGLGRYPGAKLTSVNVQASGKDGDGKGVAVLGFTAPGTATQVADWYAGKLADQGRPPSRSGNTLTGTTEDGDAMVIAVEDGQSGIARGRITITDRKG
jgi:hypothetical protein